MSSEPDFRDTTRFKDRRVLVTGGANGIGRRCVELLLARGANVVVADFDRGAGEALVSAAVSEHLWFEPYDASSPNDAERCVRLAVDRLGGLDVLVNCAGIVTAARPKEPDERFGPVNAGVQAFLQLQPKEWQTVLDVNLTGSFAVAQAVSREMVLRGTHGSIVLIASVAAANPAMASDVSYGASKAGVVALAKHLGAMLGSVGIRVNAVGPGPTATAMSKGLRDNPDALHRVLATIPIGRLGQPSEIAEAVLFLAGDESAFITGETLYVDGGYFTS